MSIYRSLCWHFYTDFMKETVNILPTLCDLLYHYSVWGIYFTGKIEPSSGHNNWFPYSINQYTFVGECNRSGQGRPSPTKQSDQGGGGGYFVIN